MLRAFGLWRKKRTKAQTVAEYALIVALVAILSITILTAFGNQLRDLYNVMTSRIAGGTKTTTDKSLSNSDADLSNFR